MSGFTYINDENGYTIATVKVYGRSDLVTVVGNKMAPTPGKIIKMKGEWTTHHKYGEQFKIAYYNTAVPASVYGIQRYLGSGLNMPAPTCSLLIRTLVPACDCHTHE